MNEKRERNPIWWILGISVSAIVVLLAFSYSDWNSRNRPPLVSGRWYMDDLRTDEIEKRLVTFSPSGEFDGDTAYGMRWRLADNRLQLRSWRLNDESPLARELTDTTLYSWFADADEALFSAEFSEDGSVLTIALENSEIKHRLRREKP
jgi:hypothetical protein